MEIQCASSAPPLGGALTAELHRGRGASVRLAWGSENCVTPSGASAPVAYGTSNDLIRILERNFSQWRPLEVATLNHWLTYSLSLEAELPDSLEYLDATLGPLTYLLGESLSAADLAVFSTLHVSSKFEQISKSKPPKNVLRWMRLVKAQPCVASVLDNLPEDVGKNLAAKSTRKSPAGDASSGSKQEGKFVDLPGAEMGKVVVRFPPEASGYLHIGHAKAALLNQYYQEAFKGKLIMRFDDTNPAKENIHFEKVILEDVEMLELKPDMFTHTSQYFELMLGMCEKLIKEGKAFIDDTPAEQMKTEREQKVESKNRQNSVDKNLQLWKEMKAGSEVGVRCCVRAKIDMQSANGCMRDPTIYRCKPEPHPRTGTEYKVYPTYDFACPIVDSIEGVTHVLRTMEYHDRDPQFYWFIEALGLRRPYIWEYSRLSMTNTVLSKRKLTWFVEQGLVDGWDDPRMPTVRGVLRRGMTVEGLRQFITAQGSSRSVVFMEWDKIWAINKKVIDPIAPRFTALETKPVPVNLSGASESTLTVSLHPKNPDVGSKIVWVAPRLLIDQADATTLKEGENATFINYGNVTINKIHRAKDGSVTSVDGTPNLDNKDYKKTLKLTWLADSPKSPATEAYCVYFDHIMSKPLIGKDEDFKQFIGHQTRWEVAMLGEPALAKVKVGDIIQLQRRGFFRVDVAPGPRSELSGRARPAVLFHVPDGHTKEQPGQAKPAVQTPAPASKTVPVGADSAALGQQVAQQGDLVRSLKASKADKAKTEEAVKQLLTLKAKYKEATGQEWKPSGEPAAPAGKTSDLSQQVALQGDLVRSLKASKADKAKTEEAVKQLLTLKAKYKEATGQEWKPSSEPAAPSGNTSDLSQQVALQGDLVRSLKASKADKAKTEEAVKQLLTLKAKYKEATGQEWKPSGEPAAPAGNTSDLSQQVGLQGDLVRSLKASKADKVKTEEAVKQLLTLKAKYKEATGQEWKPSGEPAAPAGKTSDLSQQVALQGDLVRSLKASKADKAKTEEAVKQLLTLKAKYKEATGQEWKPTAAPTTPAAAPPQDDSVGVVLTKIIAQGDRVRQLKAEKADKAAVEAEVKKLLALKVEYKALTGTEWSPNAKAPAPAIAPATPEPTSGTAGELSKKIAEQGVRVRSLKERKADKAAVQTEVQTLLALKADYKKTTGRDWTPDMEAPAAATPVVNNATDGKAANLATKVTEQGALVRDLKAKKADKNLVDDAVKKLLELKAQYQTETGTAYTAPAQPAREAKAKETKPKEAKPKEAQPKEAKSNDAKPKEKKESKPKEQSPKPAKEESSTGVKKVTRLGLEANKDTDLSEWYSQVITKAEMIEYYDISGCYILRPWSFSIWEVIRDFLSTEFKKLGVKDCYFPIFVSKAVLEREKSHIADFAPEVAWVTHSGSSELAEHIAVRPTSETVMYPAYAKWIQSHRDLPLRLNQWNNVVRWEFKQPQPFIRTREFLWQEGHTAFLTREEADEEVLVILELYARVYEELLAIPVVRGRKSEKEKFAGGDYTTTVEGYVPASGRGIQGATSHHLGQNFSKMFEIVYDDPETQERKFVYQNSWGITTRTIGVMVLVHGDDRGLVLPPRVASVQVVVVPCGVTAASSAEDRRALLDSCRELERAVAAAGVRAEGDYRDNYSPGWKFNHWELKGVPIRVELGPKDMARGELVAVRRLNGEKITLKRDTAPADIKLLLERTHDEMLAKATAERDARMSLTTDWSEFTADLERKHILLAPFCGEIPCEDNIKNDSARQDEDATTDVRAPAMGAKSLCIPFEQPRSLTPTDKCIHPSCTNRPKFFGLFGRSY